MDESECAILTIFLSSVLSIVGFIVILILMGVVVDITRNTLDRSVLGDTFWCTRDFVLIS